MKNVIDPVKLLVDSGLLFEINRKLLHPHGLAIAVTAPTEPDEFAAAAVAEKVEIQIWDCRDDPEGILFEDETYAEGMAKYTKFVLSPVEIERRRERERLLGFFVQSLGGQTSSV